MLVSDLYAPHGPFVGQELYIVGSGASLGVFPRAYLQNKTCILLNDTCRYAPELGPVGFANNKVQYKFVTDTIKWKIVKARLRFDPNPERDDNHVSWDSPEYYCFSYREPPWDTASHRDEKTLWKEPCHYWCPHGSSVAVYAVQFAIHAGAKAIFLVGCDCCEMSGGQHYIEGKRNHAQHDYSQYAVGLTRMAKEAHKRSIPMLSLTPFFGLGYHSLQYGEMKRWRNT